jgi:phage shock protein E
MTVSTLIDRETVQEMVRRGAQLLEVLPAKEYAEDHLPGAVSHPLKQLDQESGDIDRSRAVIVYCWDSA